MALAKRNCISATPLRMSKLTIRFVFLGAEAGQSLASSSLKTARQSLVVGSGTFVMVQEILLADCLPFLWLATLAVMVAGMLSLSLAAIRQKPCLAKVPSASRVKAHRAASLSWSPQDPRSVLSFSGVNEVFTRRAAHSFLIAGGQDHCHPWESPNALSAWNQVDVISLGSGMLARVFSLLRLRSCTVS